jgi:hypothetical protein
MLSQSPLVHANAWPTSNLHEIYEGFQSQKVVEDSISEPSNFLTSSDSYKGKF